MRRLLRLDPRLFVEISANVHILTYRGKIFRVNFDNKEVAIEHVFRKTMNNPLYFCVYQGADQTLVLYGEYFSNPNREKVGVFARKGQLWERVFAFEEGVVQHIHNIIHDSNNTCFYIFTGDKNNESNIWKADLSFKSVTSVIGGEQQYRSCFGNIVGDFLYYSTDTPLETNKLIKLNLINMKTNILARLEGPVIYGLMNKNTTIFSTSVEPDSRLLGFKYLLSFGVGPGIRDKFSHVYRFNTQETLTEIAAFKKDFLPAGLFQFGTVQPVFVTDDFAVLYGMGIKKLDNKTILINLEGPNL